LLTPEEIAALLLSFKVAGWGVLVAAPFAVGLGYLLARAEFPGKLLLEGLVNLPLVLPPVVIGYLLLLSFGVRGPIGGWLADVFGIRLVFSWVGAALATGIVTLPFQVRMIRLAVESVDPRLETIAETLGAGWWDRFLKILMPLTAPGVIAGAITAFSAGLGQFGAIITFVGNIPGETRTLPLAIYAAIQTPGGETQAARLAMLAVGLALVGLFFAEWLGRRARIGSQT
jgi:molybdate transport system permease protein